MEKSMSTQRIGANASPESKKIVNHLIEKLQAIFPAWRTHIKSQEELNRVKEQWYLALVDGKVNTFEKLALGLKKARQFNKPFWPSCGMFIEWCNQGQIEALEIPDFYDAFKSLVGFQGDNRVRLSPYVFWMYRAMDFKRFKESRAEASEKYLRTIYDRMVDKALSGYEFEAQPLALEQVIATEKTDAEIELSAKNLDELKEVFA